MAKIGGPKIVGRAAPILLRWELATFIPAIALAGLWFGTEALLLVSATALGVAWVTRPLPQPTSGAPDHAHDGLTALPLRAEAVTIMDALVQEAANSSRATTCLVLGFDDPQVLVRQLSHHEFDHVLQRTVERLRGALRDSDQIARLEGARLAILLKPTPRADLESMIQLSVRLQAAVEAPLSVAARTLAVSCHIGFCMMSRTPDQTGAAMLEAAETAADAARRNGPSGIRAFSPEVQKTAQARTVLSSEIAGALENGDIVAFFQPQLSTDTGAVSGMQAVPRWLHPQRGVLLEDDILPAIDSERLRARLAEVILFQSFHALRDWDRTGLELGPVSLPVSADLMANPKMADRLRWEFDRFEITPGRIRLVLPQNVMAQIDEEVIAHNLMTCAEMGCRIELAGFGLGPTSVSSIRRSAAQRLRIHRTFVARVDCDPEQQRLMAAIISMAEGLGLETLAEGVSTLGEHAMLSQLGCNHVQGKAIATPMPLAEVHDWALRHRAKLEATPQIGRKRGE
jgi:diguanylate cyclase (GGDEF)-like protein